METSWELTLHIVTGSIAVLSGATALTARKGSRAHRYAGRGFFYSMVAMAAFGTYLAFQMPQMITVLAGLFTGYLVVSSWLTIINATGKTAPLEYVTSIAALGVGFGGIYFGLEAMNDVSGLKDGFPSGAYFFFATLALIASALDFRMFYCGGISGVHRIARHLWRMCFAFYLALGSFITQGAKSLPAFIQESPFLYVPELSILVLMLFWLARVYFRKPFSDTRGKTLSTEGVSSQPR